MQLKTKFFAGLILTAGLMAGLVVSGRMSLTQPGWGAQAPAPERGTPASGASLPATGGLPDLSPIAERALKVAANISSTSVTVVNDPVTRFFYGRDLAQQSQSLGSGVVVSPDGYVLTNTHVIGNARADIRVTLSDGKERQGKLIGFDEVTDLAVVKVDAKDLPTLPWGDSSKLRVAQWVLAIGNPFQLSGTVTLGIVSTVSRSGNQVGAFKDLIQTDAAINPGNSGGALVDARGELVGINSMIYTETGGYQGIGFAIPSNVARGIMDELIKHGEVRYGSIGEIAWRTIDRETAQYNGLGDTAGVMVWQIDRGSSAYRAGLRPRDLVVGMVGQKTPDLDHLGRLVIGSTVGSTAKLDVMRSGRHVTIDVQIVPR
jgi:S1-C subfamily serine protease